MKGWEIQKFLNSAHSYDSGWLSFGVRVKRYEHQILSEVPVRFVIADCSNKSSLEFDLSGLNEHGVDMKQVRKARIRLARRRKKWDIFHNAVVEFDKKIRKAYDQYEKELDAIAPEVKKIEKERKKSQTKEK